MQIKAKQKRDYYAEIDKALKSHEQYKPYHDKPIDWICNRIGWCWKFHHITENQMEELADRAYNVIKYSYGI